MKKKYFLLNFAALLLFPAAYGQVVNGDFELVKPNFLPSNWGMNFVQPVTINIGNGQSTSDTILYTSSIPSMVYATNDAHTGLHAMEISNALNQTQNIVIPGEATVFADPAQDFPGWNAGIPVPDGAHIERLGFYYKFFPVGSDVAQAKMTLLDANGNQIGTTSVDIHATTGNEYDYIYSYIYHPYYIAPAYMYVTFKMAKPGTTATFGSRLIIDNVITNPESLEIIENQENGAFTIFPTLATNELNVMVPPQAVGVVNYKVINMQGRVVKQISESRASQYVYTMSVSDLSTGLYLLEIESNLGKTKMKFVKR